MKGNLMTVQEVAEHLQLSPMTVYKWVENGRIPVIRLGYCLRFRPSDIERAKKQDAIWERSKELMRNAVRTIMAEFAVDLETALDWVNSASGMTALAMDDEPKC